MEGKIGKGKGGEGREGKGPRKIKWPRAPKYVNPALCVTESYALIGNHRIFSINFITEHLVNIL